MSESSVTRRGASPCGREHFPLASPMLDDPRPFYARARRDEPVFWSDSLNLWVVTRHEDVCAVAKDAARFSSLDSITPGAVPPPPELFAELVKGYPLLPSLVDSDPPVHTRGRALVTKALSLRRLAEFEPILREIATRLVDGFVAKGRVELVHAFAIALPGNFIVDLLGLPRGHLDQVDRWTTNSTEVFSGQKPLPELIEHARGFVAFQHYLAAAIEDRRASPRDDALSDIVTGAAALDPPFGVAELVNMLLQILFAGYETTAGLIAAAAFELARDPELFAAAKRDPSILPSIVEETLRVASPIHAMYRTALEDVELGGVHIKKGERLQIAYISANHDERRFEEPLRFDVRRTTPHLAFGHGIHYCIGAPLARLEGRVALEVLTERLPHLRLVPDQKLSYFPSATARRLESLELAWDPAR
ncbi:cytochrome P450 [Polyangium spumosum]|uniref:Cytochrome P450 n=1 Tax=Polyangium spumosum TaxID=889282 RepID=A0A6N7PFP2_9BACT|nr:cytochrome P450 [Polyangium spumosum]MRG90809.1 cytochrome P450 [Polyangium spumosum]